MSQPSVAPRPPEPTSADPADSSGHPRVAGSGVRRSLRKVPITQHATRLFLDWIGIVMVFLLWFGMLLLAIHIIIIPRTCAQHWPSWVPLLGNLRSVLGDGSVVRAACLGISKPLSVGAPSMAVAMAEMQTTYTIPNDFLGFALALVALASAPLLLSFGAALIAQLQQTPRARHLFQVEQEQPGAPWSKRERDWKLDVFHAISGTWTIEAKRAFLAQQRMMQHACMYGLATSAVFGWSLILNNSTSISCQTRMMGVAAASAAMTSFCLSFGRIAVRASMRDTSARMFAFALRGIVTSVLAAILLTTLLWHHPTPGPAQQAASGSEQKLEDPMVLNQQPLKSPTGFLMLGMVVALIGESILSQLTARAASVVNLTPGPAASDGQAKLTSIDGLSEQDILRLGEEGIDSIHALAMCSTAYLYFSTPYTLQRICDWQNQALLITYVGLAKAQNCREKLMVRGAIDLQRKADFLISETVASDEKKQAERDQTFEIIRSSLGFISIEQARESLFPIANDELIRRLRVYQRGSVHE